MARVKLLRLLLVMATIGIMCSACDLLTDFKVREVTVNPETAYSGDEITVTVDVKNSGWMAGDYKVVLKRDGTDWMTKYVNVKADSFEEVSFPWVEDPIGQTEKKTIEVSVGDLSDSFRLLGRKKMGASVSITADGIAVTNTNDYAWMNVRMELDPESTGGGYVYSWDGPIVPYGGEPENLFVVGWWQFWKNETSYRSSAASPRVLRITAQTEWRDDITWSGENADNSRFEEVLST